MTPAPFDTVAAEYDAAFTEHRLGRWLRAAVWEHLDAAFAPGNHVLDLGCGTGEDAVHLAQRGVRIHATDGSSAMIDLARHKALLQGVGDHIIFSQLDLNTLDSNHPPTPPHSHTPTQKYDGAFSNFGALNSLPDRRPLAEALARWIRPGGRLVLVVMGPWCLWEWGWYLAQGRLRTASRRFRSGGLARVGEGATMRVWYPSPRRLRKEFGPYFRPVQTIGIGVLLPPTFGRDLVDRRPGFFERLAALDRRAGRVFPGTWLNDHYLTIFERTEQKVEEELPGTHSDEINDSSEHTPSRLRRSTPLKRGMGALNEKNPLLRGVPSAARRGVSATHTNRHGQKGLARTNGKQKHLFTFACPQCGGPLEPVGPEEQRCPVDGLSFHREDGIWRFLTPERAAYFRQFLDEYATIRRAEGRGSDDPAYYRALPFDDRTARHRRDWRIRAKSYRVFVDRVLRPLEARLGRPLKILDLGAGNGWLSARLAQRGHRVAAIDLQTNAFDGLGAHVHYDIDFLPLQAEFDRLPFAKDQFDLALFNASFHYTTDYAVTLREGLRVVKPEGEVVLLDSPVYRDGSSGAAMVREREATFERAYGFASNAIPCENYLTDDRLEALAASLDLRWQIHAPFYGWRWAARPWIAKLRRRREPARFLIVAGRPGIRAIAQPSALRLLWRFVLRWRFRLFQRHRMGRRVVEKVVGRTVVVLPQVFNPRLFRTGAFLARTLDAALIPPGAQVLDMGTGTGIGAIVAAQWADHVDAVDINPEAVRCARLNASCNDVEDCFAVYEGDLFEPVRGRRYDVVLFNPPYFRGRPTDALDQAWRSDDVVERFAGALPGHLTDDGYALVVLSSDGDSAAFLDAFRRSGLHLDVVARQNLINEVLTIYRLQQSPRKQPDLR